MDEIQIVMEQLAAIYDQDKDVEKVRKIAELQHAVVQAYRRKEDSIQDIIRGLAENLRIASDQEAQAQQAYLQKKEARAVLNEKRLDIQNNILRKEQHLKKSQDRLAALREEIQELENEAEMDRNAEKDSGTSKEAMARHSAEMESITKMSFVLGLYAHISRIDWDYTSASSPELSGRVIDSASGHVRPFHFDKQAVSSFEMANKLWDVIG